MKHSIDKIKGDNSLNLPIITVYGSSTCKSDSNLYNQSIQVGRELGSNFIVVSGGYTGIMDGLSKGVSEIGGFSIGITTEEITKVEPSKYLTKEYRQTNLMNRLQVMLNVADLHLFMAGSTGTLTELALVWDKQKLGILPTFPVLLLGKIWHKIFDLMFKKNSEVQLSRWKLDREVERNTVILDTVDDLRIWILSYHKNKSNINPLR